jgi:thiamine biosynthesis lipoprotein
MKIKLFILLAIVFTLNACQNTPAKYIAKKGMIYGTYYSIKYEHPEGKDIQQEIDKELQRQAQIF